VAVPVANREPAVDSPAHDSPMDKIIINDLEMFYRVGVPEEERATPQRLLISVELARDLSAAAAHDDLSQTIDYYAVTRRLLGFGEGRSWKLLEKLAADIAGLILAEFRPDSVSVEVKKFIVSEARHVAVQLTRSACG
jgi:FolB domain-containing protein